MGEENGIPMEVIERQQITVPAGAASLLTLNTGQAKNLLIIIKNESATLAFNDFYIYGKRRSALADDSLLSYGNYYGYENIKTLAAGAVNYCVVNAQGLEYLNFYFSRAGGAGTHTAEITIIKLTGAWENWLKKDENGYLQVKDPSAVAILTSILAVLGTTADVAVEGDAAGTISAKLRGLLKTLGIIGAVAAVDGSQAAQLRYIGEAINNCKIALEIMDDWDESDRCKVNLIAAQAGVDGNSGNKSDKTLRMILATDDIPTALVNTNLGIINTSLGTINTSLGTINISIGTVNTNLGTIITALGTVNSNLGTIITALGTINTSLGTINTTLTTTNTKLDTVNSNLTTLITSAQLIDDIVYASADAIIKGALTGGKEIAADPGAGTADKFYPFSTYHKMLVTPEFDILSGSAKTTPLSKALPNNDVATIMQNASTSTGDGTTYTNVGNYTDVVFYIRTGAVAGGTPDTTDVYIESSPDGTYWHPEQNVIGTTIATPGGINTYAPITFNRPMRKYWKARTVKNGVADTLATTVTIMPSAE